MPGSPTRSCPPTSVSPSTPPCGELDFLGADLAAIDRLMAVEADGGEEVRRLLTIPGVDVTTAATLLAVIGDLRRFPSSRHLVGYLG